MKPYSQQFRECTENGNLISVELSKDRTTILGNTALICIKYKKECNNSVCFNERLSPEELETLQKNKNIPQ